jgi:hexosaminidase
VKLTLPSLLGATLLACAGCGPDADPAPLVPRPAEIAVRAGGLDLKNGVGLSVSDPDDADLLRLAELLAIELRAGTGLPVSFVDAGAADIRLSLDPDWHAPYEVIRSPIGRDESYRLTSGRGGIDIRAGTHAGLFYGTRTLLQLMPAAHEGTVTVPLIEITDHPRFPYRGLHLDVARHFFPPEFVKRYIDLLARYKLNVFHWHLTDDQGWRLQIDRYPRLTEVGAWREETLLDKRFDPYVGDGVPHGGFYTKDEVRDIVAYAAQRYVTVIPEIEMPGHAVAALAAYPALGCTPGPFEVATGWGVMEDIYCPHERTFAFLEGVLDEVMELFPSPYIHVGGDEAPKRRWRESPVAQEVMRRENLADELELQSWFIRRIESYLAAHGRRLIGWDEILEGGLAPRATVMSWRGVEGGVAAAREGHDVIMTPTSHMYFDYYQSRRVESEPLAIGGYLPLETVYAFEPIPVALSPVEARHVLGAQGNVWTEYLKTPERVEYMAYPRTLALAEVAWTPPGLRSWSSFVERLPGALGQLDALGVAYRIPEPVGLEDRLTTADRVRVELRSPLPGVEVHYTLDGEDPSARSPVYRHALELPVDSVGLTVSARVIRPDGRLGPVARARYARTTLHRGLDIDSRLLQPGLTVEYVEADLGSAAEVDGASLTRIGIAPRIDLSGAERSEGFGLRFTGYIRVPHDDIYTFEITSDDGSQLYVDDHLVVDHDGYHGASAMEGSVGLSRGVHRLRVLYFQAGGGKALGVRVRRGYGPPERVPDSWYYVDNPLQAGTASPAPVDR